MRARELVARGGVAPAATTRSTRSSASSPTTAVTIVKVFLHISREYQLERQLRRLDRVDKRWKFDRVRHRGPRALAGLPGRLRGGARALQHAGGAVVRRARRPQVVPDLGGLPARCWRRCATSTRSGPSARSSTCPRCARGWRPANAYGGARPRRPRRAAPEALRPVLGDRAATNSQPRIGGRRSRRRAHGMETSRLGLLESSVTIRSSPVAPQHRWPSTDQVAAAEHLPLVYRRGGTEPRSRSARPRVRRTCGNYLPSGGNANMCSSCVRRAPLPLRLLVPGRRLAAGRAGGRGGAARLRGARADRPQRRLRRRWSTRRRRRRSGCARSTGRRSTSPTSSAAPERRAAT